MDVMMMMMMDHVNDGDDKEEVGPNCKTHYSIQ